MPLPWIIYILTALAVVVVVLTRLRLGRGETGAARFQTSPALLNVHTVIGSAAILCWIAFLVSGKGDRLGNSLIGIAALALLWITAVVGLMILVRWLPSQGKHSSGAVHDTWSQGPGLSVLAHVGMVVGVGVCTWAYLTSAI